MKNRKSVILGHMQVIVAATVSQRKSAKMAQTNLRGYGIWNNSLPSRNWLVAFCVTAVAVTSLSQDYSVEWWKVSGGGGISSGGVYAAGGTIGQPDASTAANGGQFRVEAGFWVLGVVQDANVPRLTLQLSSTNTIVLFWAVSPGGFGLQEARELISANWAEVDVPSVVVDGVAQVTLPVVATNRFFRLHR